MKRWKRAGCAAAAVFLLASMSGCGKDKESGAPGSSGASSSAVSSQSAAGTGETEAEALTSYPAEAGGIPALDPLLAEAGVGELKKTKLPKEDAEDPEYVYTYKDVEGCGAVVETYVNRLLAEESPFQIVDEEGAAAEPPDFTEEKGEVFAARNVEGGGTMARVQIVWKKTNCTVTLKLLKSTLEVEEAPAGQAITGSANDATADQLISYIQSLPPSALGLEGAAMSDYLIYPEDGMVFVDGRGCLQFNVYTRRENVNTNEIVGSYLITGDKSQLYRLDRDSGTVTVL